jgi:hypothetical protein
MGQLLITIFGFVRFEFSYVTNLNLCKNKANLSLRLQIEHHAMNTHAGVEVLDGGDWSASRLGHFNPNG